jgi:hypothetical protein
MHASQGTAPVTQTSLPATDHVLAELGSVYPIVSYWGAEDAGAEESADVPGGEDLAEHLDEVIFAGIVAMR